MSLACRLRHVSLFRLAGLVVALSFGVNDRAHAFGASDVVVRYTPFGIAHVEARTFKGAGVGYGWAFARDNLCAAVEQAVKFSGDRSRHLAPDETYMDYFAGGEIANADSDAAYRYLLSSARISELRGKSSKEMLDLISGYVRGFNQHVDGTPLAGEDCRTKPWFRRMTDDDVLRVMLQIPLLETTNSVLREMMLARPPGEVAAAGRIDTLAAFQRRQALMSGGSNAAAFGKNGVAGGQGGFSFANPHYIWMGTARLHAMHLNVRGRLNVFGATPYGLPFPMMGFNESLGWGITHTTDKRSTVYELQIDPVDATRYIVDGVSEAMRPVQISVPTASGHVLKTIWETRYGPMISSAQLQWTASRGYAFADPERGNLRLGEQFLAIAQARDVRQLAEALRQHHGSPWSNITAADRGGEALYANPSVAAFITDEQLNRCAVTSPARQFMDLFDLTVLDGSVSACAWTKDRRALQDGIIPMALRPLTFRSDVTFNSNDSYWLSSIESGSRLNGFPKVIGPEGTVRGERTRMVMQYAQDVMQGPDKGVTPQNWEAVFFSSRNLTAELVLGDILEDCRKEPIVTLSNGKPFDLTEACDVLSRWDRTDKVSARGSKLFGLFVESLPRIPMTGFTLSPELWRVAFDPSRPKETPRGFVPDPQTRLGLALAARTLAEAGLPLDAPLGHLQYVERSGKTLPIPGSRFSYQLMRFGQIVPGKGFPEALTGDSYIHAVSLTQSGPAGRFLVTYSQSTNPQSPHFYDMTELFSRGVWADVAFGAEDIRRTQVGDAIILN